MSIKLVSWNVNGIRAVSKKDEFWDWFENSDADVINFQEVRATQDSKVTNGLGIDELDSEGRVLKIEYEDFILYNIYFPNSGMEAKRLDFKVDFCNALIEQLVELKSQGKNIVVTGDYNIAHNPIDVYNPKNCEGKSGYLPEERAWLDELEKAGFVDTFRMFDEGENNFTWWSYRTRARERNAGWRLDYFYVNEEMKDRVKSAEILNEIYGSDHCPVTLELDF